MSVVKANTFQDASGGSNAVFSGVANPPNSMGFRNRIINGDMRIDQRNAGASVTPSASAYTLDRWQIDIALASKFSVQQVSDAPATFTNSVKLTVVSSYTPSSTNAMFFRQNVEGLNMADLAWGTASAQSITVSFWVKASVTGTYSLAIGNNANNYSYIATYAVSSASTWEFKTVTIAGPTAGTWLSDNNAGLRLKFDIGSGSNYNGTAGAWAAADVGRTSGSVVLGSTGSATWQITGVQLEAGTNASAFERRDYGRELMMCQRYFEKSYDIDVVPGTATANGVVGGMVAFSATPRSTGVIFKVTKRASATLSYWDIAGNSAKTSDRSNSTWTSNLTGNAPAVVSSTGFLIDGVGYTSFLQYTAASEL